MPLHSDSANSAGRGDHVFRAWWSINHRIAVDRLDGRTPPPTHLLVAGTPGLMTDERRFLLDLFEDRLMGSVAQLIRTRFGPFDHSTPEVLDITEPAGWVTPPPAPPHPGVVALDERRRRREHPLA